MKGLFSITYFYPMVKPLVYLMKRGEVVLTEDQEHAETLSGPKRTDITSKVQERLL